MSKLFWRWSATLRITGLVDLSIGRNSEYYKRPHLADWGYFCLQVRGRKHYGAESLRKVLFEVGSV
jgi:hypothetical protein